MIDFRIFVITFTVGKEKTNKNSSNLFLQSIFISYKFRRDLVKCSRVIIFKFDQIFVSNLSNIDEE